MTSSRRLSLRARMLILLIAVTAVFLLIMGAVTTAVLSHRVSNLFTADLIAEATHNPAKLADNTDGYLAVAVSVRTGQIVQITPGQQTRRARGRPERTDPGRVPGAVHPPAGHDHDHGRREASARSRG